MAAPRTRAASGGLILLLVLTLLLSGEAALAGAASAATGSTSRASVVPAAREAGHDGGAARKKAAPKNKAAAKKAAAKKAAAKKKARKRYVYSPRDRTSFNYPLSPELTDRFRIRHQIRMAIQHAPPRSAIRLATFTFNDDLLTDDLIAAHKRGVSVQVLVARQLASESAPLRRLTAGLKQARNRSATGARPSFTRICVRSCRGPHGLLHTKLFMFSTTGTKPRRAHWVTMIGSANLTRFAAVGQWNHMNTVLGKQTYLKFLHVYNQMKRDTAVQHTIAFRTKKVRAWVYPKPGYTFSHDPLVRALRNVDCTYRPTGSRKTFHSTITIAMYAWFDTRGDDLAKMVRQKWEHGCRVAVIYAVTNGPVLSTLRSRAGRGPIPMRRSVTLDGAGEVLDYNHSKYLTLAGRYDGRTSRLVWTGSMNFTALGVVSDELVVRLHGSKIYNAYRANFGRVWHSPSSKRVG